MASCRVKPVPIEQIRVFASAQAVAPGFGLSMAHRPLPSFSWQRLVAEQLGLQPEALAVEDRAEPAPGLLECLPAVTPTVLPPHEGELAPVVAPPLPGPGLAEDGGAAAIQQAGVVDWPTFHPASEGLLARAAAATVGADALAHSTVSELEAEIEGAAVTAAAEGRLVPDNPALPELAPAVAGQGGDPLARVSAISAVARTVEETVTLQGVADLVAEHCNGEERRKGGPWCVAIGLAPYGLGAAVMHLELSPHELSLRFVCNERSVHDLLSRRVPELRVQLLDTLSPPLDVTIQID